MASIMLHKLSIIKLHTRSIDKIIISKDNQLLFKNNQGGRTMYLKNIDWKSVTSLIVFIRNLGGWNLLRNLKTKKLANKRGKIKCSCCKKTIGEKAFVLVIKEKPIFEDSFHSPKCAEISLRWLLAVCLHFQDYVQHDLEKISEDEIRDFMSIQDGETLRAYGKRYEKNQAQKQPEV